MKRGEILESWKEIAAYLGHSIRCCQLWERKMKMPVHRLDETPKAHVFAYKSELDHWLETVLEFPKRSIWQRLSDILRRDRR
jgi:hypothetical protein